MAEEEARLGGNARVLLGGGAGGPRGGQARERVQRAVQALGRDRGVDRKVEQLARGQRRDARAPEERVDVRRVLRARVCLLFESRRSSSQEQRRPPKEQGERPHTGASPL